MTSESAGEARENGNPGGLTPEERLRALGLELPSVPSAVGDYEPWVEVNGIIYTSGQLPWIDGEMKYTGKLGDKLTVEDGYQSFRISALNAIAQLKSAVGELSRIKRIVRVEGSVQATPDFTEQPQALNGASHLITDVFGAKGRHSRMNLYGPGDVSGLHDVGGVVGGGGAVTPHPFSVTCRSKGSMTHRRGCSPGGARKDVAT